MKPALMRVWEPLRKFAGGREFKCIFLAVLLAVAQEHHGWQSYLLICILAYDLIWGWKKATANK